MRISDWSSDVCSSDLADLDRRLDGLVLQNEAIVTDTEVRPDDRTRADVGGKPVSGRLRAMVLVLAEPVQPVIGERDVHARLVRRKALLNLAEGQEGQSVERSEEHTSELQSLMRISYAVFCLKKKNNHQTQ